MVEGNNWYNYCGNNPVLFIDPMGLYILSTNKSYNAFYMNDSSDNLNNSDTPVSVSGCFATAYGREANTWSAYKYEQSGGTLGENLDTWENSFSNAYNNEGYYSANPGEENLILRTAREDMFEATFGTTPKVHFFAEQDDIVNALTSIVESNDPSTVIGVVSTGNGKVHAFNIDGYDPETGIVTGYDTLKNTTNRESFHVSELANIRTMTKECENE